MIRPLLRRPGRLASELPSLGRHPNDMLFRRLQRADGSHYGVAEDGTTVEYSDDEVAILEVGVGELGTRIALAFDLEPSVCGPSAGIDAHCIATFEWRGLRCPVFLLLANDDDHFTAIVARIITGTTPAIAFIPTPRRLGVMLQKTTAAKGVAVVALSDTAAIANGILISTRPTMQLLPDATSRADGELPARDGVYGHTRLVYLGIEHKVDLTEREERFLRETWDADEVRLDLLMHPKHGLISKKRFTNSPQNRNLVSRFLKGLNQKLQLESTPRVSFGFSLPARSDAVIRQRHE